MAKENTFHKEERLCSSRLIDMLFSEGDRSTGSFPVRLVWCFLPESEPVGVQVLVSAPKRNFKHAVDRNRIKRQIREFYRLNGTPLKDLSASTGKGIALAFLFNDRKLWPTSDLNRRLAPAFDKLVCKVSESIGETAGKNG